MEACTSEVKDGGDAVRFDRIARQVLGTLKICEGIQRSATDRSMSCQETVLTLDVHNGAAHPA